MAMYELDGNHLLPVRLGRSADAITLSHSLAAIQRQIVDVLRRPLFPLAWDEVDAGQSLTALDATGQVVVVEVLERVDSAGLLAAMSRLTAAAAAGRREIAGRYAGGLGAFSEDWNEFREAMPAQVEPGPRLTILSASLEPDVVGGLGVLASSGLEIREVDVRIVDESRVVVVVEKVSGMDVAAGGPLLVARAPRPALAGSAGGTGPVGSRAADASAQAGHTSPVTGPIEIVLPQEPSGGTDDDPEADSAGPTVPSGAFAARGAADALSELFEPVAVTTEQPQVHALATRGGAENQPEESTEDAAAAGASGSAAEGSYVGSTAGSGAGSAPDSVGASESDSSDSSEPAGRDQSDDLPAPAAVSAGGTDNHEHAEAAEPDSEPDSSDAVGRDGDGHDDETDSGQPDSHDAVGAGTDGGVGRDLADILSGGPLTDPATIDLGDDPDADEAGRADRAGYTDRADGTSAQARAVAALAGGVDILGGSSLSGGGGSAASAGSSAWRASAGAAADSATATGVAGASSGGSKPSAPPREDTSPSRMERRARERRSQTQEDAHPGPPASHAPVSQTVENGEHSVQAAEAWSTVAPNEPRPDDPTGAVALVSWEPLRGSAEALDPVAEALGGDPSKSLVVQETAELAAVAASLGEPTQLVWQRLRRGIYHEATLSVEGVITLSDGRSFTDPTSAANAAQDVNDADGWRVWRVGVRGAHLGDLRDDLADRSS